MIQEKDFAKCGSGQLYEWACGDEESSLDREEIADLIDVAITEPMEQLICDLGLRDADSMWDGKSASKQNLVQLALADQLGERVLREVHAKTKTMISHASSTALPMQVSYVLYYLSILIALHNLKVAISSLTRDQVIESLKTLSQRYPMSDKARALFAYLDVV